MFQTVRHWWGSGRGKTTARLFAFEFLVVVAGVLVAQALANWVQTRSEFEAMERTKLRADSEIGADLHDVAVWKAALPCFKSRMKEVLADASLGPIDPPLADRPSMKTLYFTPMSDDTALLLRRRYGDQRAHLYDMIRYAVESLNNRAGRASTSWGRIALAVDGNGVVAQGDRLTAREAAADILAELRGIDIVADNVRRYGTALGIKPDASEEPGFGPASSCEAIWKSGRSDPPLGAR